MDDPCGDRQPIAGQPAGVAASIEALVDLVERSDRAFGELELVPERCAHFAAAAGQRPPLRRNRLRQPGGELARTGLTGPARNARRLGGGLLGVAEVHRLQLALERDVVVERLGER